MSDVCEQVYGDAFLHSDKPSLVLLKKDVTSRKSLEQFLQEYQANILIPHELPAITRAFRYTARNETRDLIAFDNEIASVPELKPFSGASRRIGNAQLKRLRPLSDHRVTQRYLRAVETGLANGWHTTVYGLTLSVYSLPIMEGFRSYERQTLIGFVHAAARVLKLSEPECSQIINDLAPTFPSEPKAVLGEEDATRTFVTIS